VPDLDEPSDEDDPYAHPGESEGVEPGTRHDPETQALDLLRSGLGAQSVD
jgi:hypothetical protein